MKIDWVAWLLIAGLALVPLMTLALLVLAFCGMHPTWTIPIFAGATALNGYRFVKAVRTQIACERRGKL